MSVLAKRGEGARYLLMGGNSRCIAWDWDTLTWSEDGVSSANGLPAVDMGDGWYWLSITSVENSYDYRFYISPSRTAQTEGKPTGSSGDSVLVAATSLIQAVSPPDSFSASDYLKTSGSAYYGPRITYDPVTGDCLGYLIEEQTTEACLSNTDIGNSDWVVDSLTEAGTQSFRGYDWPGVA